MKSAAFSGMIVTNPVIRKKFRTLLLSTLPESLYDRLQLIFSEVGIERSYYEF